MNDRWTSGPLELGARIVPGGARFRLFTTTARSCAVRLLDAKRSLVAVHPMHEAPALGPGVLEAHVPGVALGQLYDLLLDDRALPDPYARFLPHGVHGPAQVDIDGSRHAWKHEPLGRPLADLVFYELHVGTFTQEGTYQAAMAKLPELVDLGVTAIELLPLSAFAGERGWGYDGVAPFAPHAPYGTREDLACFVDTAHGLGLSVLLDVVYDHLGPSGNYLGAFSDRYVAKDRKSAWGDALDTTHPVVRALVFESAFMWLRDMRFDGLRLDATHAIVDPSPEHVLAELARRTRALSPKRVLVAEDDRNEPGLVTSYGLDGIWADDLHHQIHVTLAGERDGYYAAYEPGAAGIARAIERGWLYEGDAYAPHAGAPRGAPADALPAPAFVVALQNHDQIGNRAFGERLSSLPGVSIDAFTTASLLLLALPSTPLLFMGQEWAASSPFLYFTDHDEELGALVSAGRRDELRRFAAFTDPAVRARIPDPQAQATFERSRLDRAERDHAPHARVLDLHRAILHLRREDPVLRARDRRLLAARAHREVVVVERRAADPHAVRIVLASFAREPVPLNELLPSGLGDVRVLLGTDCGRGTAAPDALAKAAFVLLEARLR